MKPILQPTRLLAALLLLVASCNGGQQEERSLELRGQNLLVISIDTLRADRLGAYGDQRAQTPTIDAWSRGGVRFDHCYSAATLTLPSHSTLFTGRYPFAHGVRVNGMHYLPESELTLAERFEGQGYETFAAVSSYVLTQKFGLAQGFGTFDDSLGSGELFTAFEAEITADRVVDKFERWLEERRPGAFFAWLHFYDPHLPYEPPPPHSDAFADDPYRGEIAFVDSQLARVQRELERRGLLDTTAIFVTSDHGEAFGEHLEEGHGLLAYNETLKVPLIAFAPGRFPAGLVVESRVQLADLTPTVAELFGLHPGTDLHGETLAALLTGRLAADREVYFESLGGKELKGWAPLTGLIDGRFKLISVPEPELYDLVEDPTETTDRFASEVEAARELAARLAQLTRGAEETSPQRQLSTEDRRQLEALGYLGAAGATENRTVIDPKRGIVIDMAIRRGRTALQQGDLAAARRELAIAKAEIAGAVVADFLILEHEIEDAAGNRELAVAALRLAAEQHPALEHLQFLLARYLFSSGEVGEAESISRRLLTANPRMSQAHNLLAAAARTRGEPAEALEHLQRSLAIEPESIALKLEIIDLSVELRRLDAAVALYDEIIRAGALDGNEDRLFKAAMLHGQTGNLDRAIALFRKGLETSTEAVHRLTLALLLTRNGQPDEARVELERAMSGDLSENQKAMARALAYQLSQ